MKCVGSGYPLYFSFLKYCMVILTLLLVFSGGFNLITNWYYGGECKDITNTVSRCKLNWITELSLGNKRHESNLMFIQECLNLFTILAVIALLQFFRRDQRKLDVECDESDISSNDYTVLVENIPIEYDAINNDYDDDLKEFIQTKINARILEKREKDIAEANKPSTNLVGQIIAGMMKNITQGNGGSQGVIPAVAAGERKTSANRIAVSPINPRQTGNALSTIETFANVIGTAIEMKLEENNHLRSSPGLTTTAAEASGATNSARIALEVVKINLCYNLNEQRQIAKEKAKQIKRKQKLMKKLKNWKVGDVATITKVNAKIKVADEKLKQFQLKFEDGKGKEFMKKYFTGKALVSFLTEQMKEEAIELFRDKKLVKDLVYQGNHLKLTQAPQPSDMYWENLHILPSEKTKRQVYGMLVSILSLAICAGFIYLLLFAQESQKIEDNQEFVSEDPTSPLVFGLAILLSVSITILNVVLQWILKYLTNFEGSYTRTEYNINIAKKMAWAMFINSALIQFFIDVVFSTNSDKFAVIFGEGGLAFNQNYVFISNIILPFLSESLDLPGIWQKFTVKLLFKKQNNCFLTQSQLNEEFENPSFDIYQRYAWNLKTMYVVAFYSPILPIGILYSMVAITLIFWVDKYNLLKRKTIKYQQSAELSIEMTEMLEYILPIFSLSNTIFFIYIIGSNDVSALSWIGLAIGVIHSALPMQKWNESLFSIRNPSSNEIDYYEASKVFHNEYDLENPATKYVQIAKNLINQEAIAKQQQLQQLQHQKEEQEHGLGKIAELAFGTRKNLAPIWKIQKASPPMSLHNQQEQKKNSQNQGMQNNEEQNNKNNLMRHTEDLNSLNVNALNYSKRNIKQNNSNIPLLIKVNSQPNNSDGSQVHIVNTSNNESNLRIEDFKSFSNEVELKQQGEQQLTQVPQFQEAQSKQRIDLDNHAVDEFLAQTIQEIAKQQSLQITNQDILLSHDMEVVDL